MKRSGAAPRIVRRARRRAAARQAARAEFERTRCRPSSGLYRAEKAGHTGTLDPLATGCCRSASARPPNSPRDLLDADKDYVADVRLGVTTRHGRCRRRGARDRARWTSTAPRSRRALARFRGEIDQVPPMYSALKHDGKPLYDYARAGVELERAPRRVTIHALDPVERLDGDARDGPRGVQQGHLCPHRWPRTSGARWAAARIWRRCAAPRSGRFGLAGAIEPGGAGGAGRAGARPPAAPADALLATCPQVRLEAGLEQAGSCTARRCR